MKARNRKYQLNHRSHEKELKCSCCTRYYKKMDGFGSDQGHQCASYLYLLHEMNKDIKNNNDCAEIEKKSYINCQYGSGFDTSRFDIIDEKIINQNHIVFNRNRKARADQYNRADDTNLLVCDFCIERLISEGSIVEDMTYDPFEFIKYYEQIRLTSTSRQLTDDEVNAMWLNYPDLTFEDFFKDISDNPNEQKTINIDSDYPTETQLDEIRKIKVPTLIKISESLF